MFWTHLTSEGNLDNLILHRDSGEIYAIDTACTVTFKSFLECFLYFSFSILKLTMKNVFHLQVNLLVFNCARKIFLWGKCLQLLTESLDSVNCGLRTSMQESFKLWFGRTFSDEVLNFSCWNDVLWISWGLDSHSATEPQK